MNGNVGVVNVPNNSFGIPVTFQVTDSPNRAPDIVDFTTGRAASDCSPLLMGIGTAREVAFGGGLVVTDAQPSPTSKDQCKNGGWRNFADAFKNQGQCVAFVQRGPQP
jgi:hypothetical protein